MEEPANDNYVSNGDYHDVDKTPGISATGLIHIARSPAHFKEYLEHPPKTTPAMLRGSAIHSAILEPDRFVAEYIALDDVEICAKIGGAKPRATNAYKEWRAEWELNNIGKTVIPMEDYETACHIADKAYAHPVMRDMLARAREIEGVMQWQDAQTGVLLKARPDMRLETTGDLLDIKSTMDARADAFSRQIYTLGYFIQAAVYREAVRVVHGFRDVPFYFLAVETDAPYAMAMYRLDEAACEIGDIEFRRCVDLYAECSSNDNWPDYPISILQISVPSWSVQKVVLGL